MIDPITRANKIKSMNEQALRAVALWESGSRDHALNICNRLCGFSIAFIGVDDELTDYGLKLDCLVTDFILSDVKDFTAWAMLKACQAFQGLQLDESEEQPADYLTPQAAAENFRLAEQWRFETGYTPQVAAGYVLVYAGKVTGWINQLRDPNHWEPGVIAVGVRGSQYKAVGGDSVIGAESWQLVSTTQYLNGAAA